MEQTVQCPDKGHVLGKEKLTRWEKAGMTKAQWKEAVKFDSTDWGWVIMSIGNGYRCRHRIFTGTGRLGRDLDLSPIFYYRLSSYVSFPAIIH